VAEDNAVNQRLVVRLLERQGHRVTVVSDGRQAVAAVEREAFDAVIMDVQMPDMDGVEATRAIRAREQRTGEHLPIVALTAHAMKGDRERYLAAGMDAYVAKPVRPQTLAAAIDRVTRAVASAAGPPAATGARAPVDVLAALDVVEGDLHLLDELTRELVLGYPGQLGALGAALAAGDGPAAERVTHRLRGALEALGAGPAAGLVERIERLVRDAELSRAAAVVPELQEELARVAAFVGRPGWAEVP
jgi:CheY-like chemotaxis protein/HPt (histidine-containing phosphotransfer) domain-containing protein